MLAYWDVKTKELEECTSNFELEEIIQEVNSELYTDSLLTLDKDGEYNFIET